MQCYGSTVYAVIVCLPVRLSHVGIVPKRLNIISPKQHHMIDQGSTRLMVASASPWIATIPERDVGMSHERFKFRWAPTICGYVTWTI